LNILQQHVNETKSYAAIQPSEYYTPQISLYDQNDSNQRLYISPPEGDDDNGISRFDSDSFPIRIDYCCSRTLSFFKKDFIENTFEPLHEQIIIKGFGNSLTPITHAGTIK
jgi:hypothetical protein